MELAHPRAPFEVLAIRLNDAGIPVEAVSGNVGAVSVTYAAHATQAQRDQGAAILAAFDWTLSAERADEANAVIRAQLNDLDLRYGTRALSEALDGDRTRLDWLNAEKAKLRAQFVGVTEAVVAADPAA